MIPPFLSLLTTCASLVLSFFPSFLLLNTPIKFPNKESQDCYHHKPLFSFFWLLQESVLTTIIYSASSFCMECLPTSSWHLYLLKSTQYIETHFKLLGTASQRNLPQWPQKKVIPCFSELFKSLLIVFSCHLSLSIRGSSYWYYSINFPKRQNAVWNSGYLQEKDTLSIVILEGKIAEFGLWALLLLHISLGISCTKKQLMYL